MYPAKKKLDADLIDACLAQTQCQLCEYPDCRAYANAIVSGEADIDRCLPGGEKTLDALATLTGRDASIYRETLQQKIKPMTQAIIREEECIGCTKCIQACPVDAIIGSAKQMHTVIIDACNGCELCIPPCPVDCIDLIPHPLYQEANEIASVSKQRYDTHRQRQKRLKEETKSLEKKSLQDRRAAIEAAIQRKTGK